MDFHPLPITKLTKKFSNQGSGMRNIRKQLYRYHCWALHDMNNGEWILNKGTKNHKTAPTLRPAIKSHLSATWL